MSWTDRRTAAQVAKVWERKVVPAADAMQRRGVEHLVDSLDGEDDTWYTSVSADRPNFTTIEADQIAPLLRALWEEKDRPELAAIVEHLVAVAERINRDRGPAGTELSSDVYAMY